jgi:hypothetical protein
MSLFNSFGDRGVAFGKNLFPSAPFGTTIFPDTFAINFINVVGITDSIQQNAIIRLVFDLKFYGLWNKLKAVYPFVGGTASTHKWNLISPLDLDSSFRLTFFGGITHNSNGITGNGTTGYAQTYFTPTVNFNSLNDKHFSVYVRNNISSGAAIGSATAGDIGDQLFPRFGGGTFFSNSSGVSSYTNGDSRRMFLSSRISSTVARGYMDGVSQISLGTSVSQFASSFVILARDRGTIDQYSAFNLAFVSIGDGLNDTEAANLYYAAQAFNSILGRSV